MRKLLFTFLTLLLLSPALPVYAQGGPDYTSELTNAGGVLYKGSNSGDLFVIIGRVINALLGLVGVILLVMILYGGVLWMTAGGKPDQVAKAKNVLINAIIGLIIILSSFAVSTFVVESIQPPAPADRGDLIAPGGNPGP